MMKKLFALRGAAFCKNSAQDIETQVTLMYDELLQKNNIDESDIVSLIFSVTDDLDAINPAKALRQSGRAEELALFAVQEAKSMEYAPLTIRALLHCYLEDDTKPRHVFRNGAEILRPEFSK
jgi:chorismate mutase